VKEQPREPTTQEIKQGLEQARARVLRDIRVLEQEIYSITALKTRIWQEVRPWFWLTGAFGVGFILGVLSSKGRKR